MGVIPLYTYGRPEAVGVQRGSVHAIFLYPILRSGPITRRLCLQVAGVKPTPSHLIFDNSMSKIRFTYDLMSLLFVIRLLIRKKIPKFGDY